MILWRLADPRYARDLTGAGNRLYGARWNSPGRGVVYAAENLSLCVLEAFVHLPPPMRAKLPKRNAIKLDLPDGLPIMDLATFPKSLRGEALEHWCRKTGDAWLADGKFPILRAPSIIVPEDRNVMINPRHPLMRDMRISSTRPFQFDERLSSG